MKKLFFLVMLGALGAFTACGADDANESGMNVEGDWRGTWEREGASGQLQFSFTQNGEILEGNCLVTGSSCLGACALSGIIDVDTGKTELLFLDPDLPQSELDKFDPEMSVEDFQRNDAQYVIKVDGEFTEEGHLTMNYVIVEWNNCDGGAGIFNLDRVE